MNIVVTRVVVMELADAPVEEQTLAAHFLCHEILKKINNL